MTIFNVIFQILCVIFQISHYFTNKNQRVHTVKRYDQKCVPKLNEMEVSTSFNQNLPVSTSFHQFWVRNQLPLEPIWNPGILVFWNPGILPFQTFKNTLKKNHTFQFFKNIFKKYKQSFNLLILRKIEPTVPPGLWTYLK